MPLQQGHVKGYDFNRMVVEFTMLNQSKVIFCAIVAQFKRLRETIEERASRKFFEEQAQADRPVVLRSIDFR